MNKICENERALALQKRQDSSAIDRESELTTMIYEKVSDILDVFSTISTATESPHHTSSTASFTTISTDTFLNLTTPDHANTDFYIVDDGASVVAKSFKATLPDQLNSTFEPATSSTGRPNDAW